QAIAHPLAQSKIEVELARLMTQKAAALYDAGDDMGAGEAANMAKYAAAEAACDAADRAVQTHGGNGITQEYGMAGLLVATRAGRIAPVSREMILNFVAMHSLGLPKSYYVGSGRPSDGLRQPVGGGQDAAELGTPGEQLGHPAGRASLTLPRRRSLVRLASRVVGCGDE